MSAVYSVDINLVFDNKLDVIYATKKFVSGFNGVRFNAFEDMTLETMLWAIFPQDHLHVTSDTDTSFIASADFNASYGWEGVIQDWFSSIASSLAYGANISYETDDGWGKATVKNGVAYWKNSLGTEWFEDAEGNYTFEDPLHKAVSLVNDYIGKEFDSDPYNVSDDLSNIGLLYTFAGDDDQVDVQVTLDLDNLEMRYEVNGELRHTDKYNSLEQLITDELENLDFNDLYAYVVDFVTDEDYEI